MERAQSMKSYWTQERFEKTNGFNVSDLDKSIPGVQRPIMLIQKIKISSLYKLKTNAKLNRPIIYQLGR